MPWTGKQHRLFEAAAHSPAVAEKVGIPVAKAAQMASEGVKPKNVSMTPAQRKSAAKILRRK